ncbi:hypothetical protein J7E83_20935 [Arthrobacter sp. ISL-48]|uniref:hypothetical protein n=1 Tax=Arthrobacter sp. ISL-48 TaxID=2819110 RepID=UPI001BEB7F84|nr:hypothetical protein [Arthrobacter sp. ISL-48]MBT2534548.1 hypothetical protein [Arthrobacter sp. ISL-48]
MTVAEFRRLVRNAISKAGAAKHGSSWIIEGSEMAWIYTLESRHGTRFSLMCGVELFMLNEGKRAKNANECRFVFSLERLSPVAGMYEVRQAFSLDFDLDDEGRGAEVQRLMSALIGYSNQRLSLAQLRRSFQSGELDNGFVHFRAREVLESGSA